MKYIKQSVGFLVLLVFCVLMEIEFSFGYIGFFTLVIIVLLIGCIYFIIGIFHSKKMLIQGSTIIVFCIVEFLISNAIIHIQQQKTYDVAENIISAIEQYRMSKGNYPIKIDDVAPLFIHNIPKTSMGWFGRPFNYTNIGVSYRLSFDFHVFLSCSYYPKSKSWYCDD